jgi:hypothetical protein
MLHILVSLLLVAVMLVLVVLSGATERRHREGPMATPRMTLRVSRDGGRTWSRRRTVRADKRAPLEVSSVWPPCQCPRHREEISR